MPIIETPIVENLPETLLAGAFKFHHALDTKAYYLFHDGTWSADLQHMLGWARQAIHSLNDLKLGTEANWLFGHGLQLVPQTEKLYPQPDKYPFYRVSGGGETFDKPTLLRLCGDAVASLEKADIHVDQWGAKTTLEWQDILANHHFNPKKNQIHKFMLKSMSALELRTFLDNIGNEEHHPEYVQKND